MGKPETVTVMARVPAAFAREIKLYALRNGVSLQQLIREALQARLARQASSR